MPALDVDNALGGSHLFDCSPTVDAGTLAITRMPTTLTLTKSAFTAAGGSPAAVTAVLQEALAPTGLIASEPVNCTFAPGKNASGTTDSRGAATCTLSGLGNGAYTVGASFGGDRDYLPATATATPLYVYTPTSFVIWGGNQPQLADAVKPGMDVNFWGAQWKKQVTAGGWAGDAAFNGYADTLSGGTWSARSGSSSKPPAGVDQYIGVIVTTSATKSGSTTTGNVAEQVVLRVDNPAAYSPDPGHSASGVVQAVTG